MNVLIAHNRYQMAGGEDSVVASETKLLEDHGHTLMSLERDNSAIGKMGRPELVWNTLWSSAAHREMAAKIRAFQPDVIHVHNTFPLLSPSIYWAASERGVPVVQTLHNFRVACPQAMFLRDGHVCEDCLGRIPWRGVTRGCYRESRAQSGVLAGMILLHRAIGTYREKVTRYIALNDFCRQKFIQGGLPAERIVIKPNFVDFEAPPDSERSGFLFVGRLSAEKGVGVLVDASKALRDVTLRVAGTGPEAACLAGVNGVEALGSLSGDAVRNEMSLSMAMILPSIWYENFPRTLVEAYGCGLPVIASRIGALAELVEDGRTGLLFDPGNAKDLAEKMAWAQAHPAEMARMGRNARALYEAEFTAERNYQQLMRIYEDAIKEVRNGERQ